MVLLNTIILFKWIVDSSMIDSQDLPKLETITCIGKNSYSFYYLGVIKTNSTRI